MTVEGLFICKGAVTRLRAGGQFSRGPPVLLLRGVSDGEAKGSG